MRPPEWPVRALRRGRLAPRANWRLRRFPGRSWRSSGRWTVVYGGASMTEIPTHPVQTISKHSTQRARCPQVVTMRAYEVYCCLYSPQPELVTGTCRGGFGVNELVALLYASGFPQEEWRARVDEALTGMEGI